jgi:MFS family permease
MTIVNVALPSIQADPGFSQSGLAWVVNAYLITFAGLLLLAGRLGDLAGRRNVFVAGLGVFTVASLLCGLAANQDMLVAARFLQGVGGALTSAVILGMIVTMFPDPREQAKAIGVFAFVASAGAAVGLLAGGILTQLLNWHWIFFVNLPVGAVTAVAAQRMIGPDRGAGLRAGADVLGAVLITGAMMLSVFTIVDTAAQQGWLAIKTLILGACSLALLLGFIIRQRTARNPLMPLRIFSSPNVAGANLVQVLGTAGMFGRAAGLIAQHLAATVALTDGYHLALWDRLRPRGRGDRGSRRHAAAAARSPAGAAAGARAGCHGEVG